MTSENCFSPKVLPQNEYKGLRKLSGPHSKGRCVCVCYMSLGRCIVERNVNAKNVSFEEDTQRETRKRKSAPSPFQKKKKKRTYKIPGVVKLKGRYVSLPRKVVRNNKNSVGR